ncbi:MAG: acylphosphatase [Rhizobiaceae bacterium]
MLICGQLGGDAFPEWVSHRAAVLDLKGWMKMPSDNFAEISVTGDRILVEAFEIACSLGPGEAMIDSIETRPGNASEPAHEFCIHS